VTEKWNLWCSRFTKPDIILQCLKYFIVLQEYTRHSFCNIILVFAIGAGFCTCGKKCKMTNGVIGVCQTDGKTCAINVQQPNCKPGIHNSQLKHISNWF
jgi:hypothetical protein